MNRTTDYFSDWSYAIHSHKGSIIERTVNRNPCRCQEKNATEVWILSPFHYFFFEVVFLVVFFVVFLVPHPFVPQAMNLHLLVSFLI